MGIQHQGKRKRKLSKTQEIFVSEYIKHGDGLVAAQKAGYASAESKWQVILDSPTIVRALAELKAERKA